MRKSRFTEEQMVGICEAERGEKSIAEISRSHGITDQTIHPCYGDSFVKE